VALDELGAGIVRGAIELVVQLFGYLTARLVLPILSLGYMRAEPYDKRHPLRRRWHGFHRARNGIIVVGFDMATFLGFLFWIVVIAAVLL
jgi:hypothetical protein